MSPALLTKYLDAAKQVAAHAVAAAGRFPILARHHPTRLDRRDRSRRSGAFYREFTRPRRQRPGEPPGHRVRHQRRRPPAAGIVPGRHARRNAKPSRPAPGRSPPWRKDRKLNAKYLGHALEQPDGSEPSLLLDVFAPAGAAAKAERRRRRSPRRSPAGNRRSVDDSRPSGRSARSAGPRRWLEPVDPLVAAAGSAVQDSGRLRTARKSCSHSLASDAGDGNEHDFVIWQRPRLVRAGSARPAAARRPRRRARPGPRREQVFADAAEYLAAADEAAAAQGHADIPTLAKHTGSSRMPSRAWLDYLGIGSGDAVQLQGYLARQDRPAGRATTSSTAGATRDLPQLVANSSDQHVRIPGNMKPHSVAVHPTPTLRVAVGWRSPVTATIRLEGTVTHAHPECGNGVTWSLELRRGADPPAARHRRGGREQGGEDRTDRKPRRPDRRPRLVADRPARRQSLLRPDGDRSEAIRPATAVERGTSPPTSRATSWPATRTPTGSATPGSGTSTPSPTRAVRRPAVIPAGLAAREVASRQESGTTAASWRKPSRSC